MTRWKTSLVAGILLSTGSLLLAETKIGGKSLQEHLLTTQKKLNEQFQTFQSANQQLQKLQSDSRAAEVALTDARKQLTETRKAVESEFEKSGEMLAALEGAEVARKELQVLRDAVIQKMTDRADYQEARKLHTQNLADQKRLSAQKEATEPKREMARQVEASAKRVRAFEDAEVEQDPQSRDAKQRLQDSEKALAAVKRQRHQAVDNDPRLKSAKLGMVRASQESKRTAQALTQLDRELDPLRKSIQSLLDQRGEIMQRLALENAANNSRATAQKSRAPSYQSLQCSNCSFWVSVTSQPGQRCPFCGVTWGSTKTR